MCQSHQRFVPLTSITKWRRLSIWRTKEDRRDDLVQLRDSVGSHCYGATLFIGKDDLYVKATVGIVAVDLEVVAAVADFELELGFEVAN